MEETTEGKTELERQIQTLTLLILAEELIRRKRLAQNLTEYYCSEPPHKERQSYDCEHGCRNGFCL